MPDVGRGEVVWVDLDPTKGSEQAGRRPALVVSGNDYNASIPRVIIVLPVTTRDRGLPHHILLEGPALNLKQASFAMTEQPRTIDRERITGTAGAADEVTMSRVDVWLRDFLDLRAGR
ncbi:type II toxin-antitoxin system PemK/MazF family toxin [Sinomonas sp. P47F7]|uniref:type II toxin-antitoxin system PemK/MazF family toxin n=1 Tax=Sinomonas sp. P47F7 TaxID=3410987 RepID=UPI003BF5FC86